MNNLKILFAGFAISLASIPTHAQQGYISDELTVPLRSGPSNQHRILHRGLPSGTALEILGEDEAAGYSQIRTSRGTEGWVRSQYLVTQPIAKLRLANAEAQLARARAELRSAQEKIRALSGDVSSQTSANAASRNRITQLESELTELKRVSGSAIELNSANLQLTETNTRLRDELDDVAEARARLESNERNQAILYGVGAILIGLLAGVLIKSRPQRSAWN